MHSEIVSIFHVRSIVHDLQASKVSVHFNTFIKYQMLQNESYILEEQVGATKNLFKI